MKLSDITALVFCASACVPTIATAADLAPFSTPSSPVHWSPTYPVDSRRLGEQGTVVLRTLISAEGVATKAEVQTSSGYERLDQAALTAVSKWKFKPAEHNGQPIESWVLIPIVFKIER